MRLRAGTGLPAFPDARGRARGGWSGPGSSGSVTNTDTSGRYCTAKPWLTARRTWGPSSDARAGLSRTCHPLTAEDPSRRRATERKRAASSRPGPPGQGRQKPGGEPSPSSQRRATSTRTGPSISRPSAASTWTRSHSNHTRSGGGSVNHGTPAQGISGLVTPAGRVHYRVVAGSARPWSASGRRDVVSPSTSAVAEPFPGSDPACSPGRTRLYGAVRDHHSQGPRDGPSHCRWKSGVTGASSDEFVRSGRS